MLKKCQFDLNLMRFEGLTVKKTVKITGKMHGEFPVIFKLFFAIIPSIWARFGPNWHFFNITFVALDF